MKSMIAFLSERPGGGHVAPVADPPPVEVIVPYSNPVLAAAALSGALDLACGLETLVTLVAVHVLPFPAPLECQEGIRHRLEANLAAIVRTTPATVRMKIVFARSRQDAFLRLLPRRSLVVVGARARWWRTREERFARMLAAAGHSVAIITVK